MRVVGVPVSGIPANAVPAGNDPITGFPAYYDADGNYYVCFPVSGCWKYTKQEGGPGGNTWERNGGGLNGGGGEMEDPPMEPDGGVRFSVEGEVSWDFNTDILSVTLPDDAAEEWVTSSDVVITTSGSEVQVTGLTNDVVIYLADIGVRQVHVPASGLVPALELYIVLGESLPLTGPNGIVGYTEHDVLLIKDTSGNYVPDMYEPVRVLTR